jgi:hypothetical protein
VASCPRWFRRFEGDVRVRGPARRPGPRVRRSSGRPAPMHRQSGRSAHQVQPQPPEVAGVTGAVTVTSPTGHVQALHSGPRRPRTAPGWSGVESAIQCVSNQKSVSMTGPRITRLTSDNAVDLHAQCSKEGVLRPAVTPDHGHPPPIFSGDATPLGITRLELRLHLIERSASLLDHRRGAFSAVATLTPSNARFAHRQPRLIMCRGLWAQSHRLPAGRTSKRSSSVFIRVIPGAPEAPLGSRQQ